MAKRILVPVDGSIQSKRALRYALETHEDAEITALHVIDPAESMVSPDETGPYMVEGWYEMAEERGEDVFEDIREIAREYGREVETATDVGLPARTIVEYADEEGFDHIVMGSHGRSGVSRVLLGSVAEAVVRRSPVPVTVTR